MFWTKLCFFSVLIYTLESPEVQVILRSPRDTTNTALLNLSQFSLLHIKVFHLFFLIQFQ